MQGKLWAYKGFFLSGNLLIHSSSTVVETSGSDSESGETFAIIIGDFLEGKRGKDGFFEKFKGYLKDLFWVADDEEKEVGERKKKVCFLVFVLRVFEREEMDNIFICVGSLEFLFLYVDPISRTTSVEFFGMNHE